MSNQTSAWVLAGGTELLRRWESRGCSMVLLQRLGWNVCGALPLLQQCAC